MPNHLINETSPYLLQHAHNPVDWYPWGEEAFERARTENKPILLSVGYSACHWCHVMEHESFESPDIARLMNELFVSIKVDREERPDVDDVYMKAVQMLTGRGGWPMTVFLTPDRQPFYGGTYFPPSDRHGLPGFPRVLEGVARAYRERPDDVQKSIGQIMSGIERIEQATATDSPLEPTLPARAAEALLEHVDIHDGGIGNAPKFPHPAVFQLFLRQYRVNRDSRLLDAIRVTCERMARGGVYDQIGGGFHRYSVDAHWLVPHFEKMLYDNAQLARLYVHGWLATGNPEYRRVAEETLEYLVREMRHPAGGFFSAQDADSEGVEGKFFVWTPDEVRAALGDEPLARVAMAYWGMEAGPNFEGHSILHVPRPPKEVAERHALTEEALGGMIAQARGTLYQARERRVHPGLDDKVLAAWNGLALATFAEAARALGRADYLAVATASAEFLTTGMMREGRLRRSWKDGEARILGYLEDHAMVGLGLLATYEATFDRRWLD